MKPLLLLIILLSPLYTYSQSNYTKGYVTVNGGNITGYIDYREWNINPESISFKTNLTDKDAIIYNPIMVSSFSIDGLEQYFSYKLKISTNKINFPDLPYGKDTSSKVSTVFLRLIVTGDNVALFTYTDGIKTRFFISEKNGQPYELTYQNYYEDGSTVVRSDRKYVGQLIYLVNKYVQSNARVFEKIEYLSYQETDMINIVNTINIVKTNTAKHTPTNRTSSFRLYFGAGLSVSNSVFHKDVNLEDAHSAVQTPQVNFGFDVFTNPNVQKFIFRFDVGLGYINPVFKSAHGETTASLSPYTVNATYTYNQYNLRVTPQVIYNLYNSNAFKFYIDGGAVLTLSKYTNQSYTSYSTAGPNYTSATSTYELYTLESEWITFAFQTGVVFNKHIETYFNYILPSTYAGYNRRGTTLETTYYNLGVHYLLGKTSKR